MIHLYTGWKPSINGLLGNINFEEAKKMKKKLIWIMMLSCVLLSFGGCEMNKIPQVLEGKEGVFAVMETTQGTIVLELFYKDAPLTVTNFVGLAEGTLNNKYSGKKFYDGLKFHRVISKANGDGQDFMIQGGDPRGNGTGGPGYEFVNEDWDGANFNEPGMLAMANAGKDTNGSQFFITIAPCVWLNGGYTVFGKVVDSDSQKIVNKTKKNDVIKSVEIVRLGEEASKFTATQDDFDNREKEAVAKARAAKEKIFKDQIAAIEAKYTDYAKDSNGIYYKTIKEGSGDKIGKRKNVSTEYKGYFVDGSVFDQSAGRGPLDFTTGAGQMISGFDVMVQDMKVGEKRSFILPPDFAYGEQGAGGVIPGNTYICFDVEVLSAK